MMRSPRLWSLALVSALMLGSTLAAVHVQLDVEESSPNPPKCTPGVVTIGDLQLGHHKTTLKVTNSSGGHAVDYISVDIVVDGNKRVFWAAVETDPGMAVPIEIDYTLGSQGPIKICSDHPIWITEGPEPVQIHADYPIE